MRRGDQIPDPSRVQDNPTFTKRDLMAAADLSAKTFDTIRKAARIKGPTHGGLDWQFSLPDVQALIHRASSGTFSERGAPAAVAWRTMLEDAGIITEVDDPPSHRPRRRG